MADDPTATVVFCVGATKAGTSWLHTQLQRHPECHLRSIKELHYFSLTTPGNFERARRLLAKDLAKISTKAPEVGSRARDLGDWDRVLAAGYGAYAAYLSYLSDHRGAAQVVADFTPAYALLPDETLHLMAGLTPDVRVIYLLRDPVERLWSHVRMVTVRARPADFAGASLQLLDDILGGKDTPEINGILQRGDYCTIIDKLRRCIPEGRLLFKFYETLFAEDGLDDVTAFVGIAPLAPQPGARVHVGKPLDLGDEAAARAKAFLAKQYDGTLQRLGALPQGWAATAG